jgi:hypothetical protein
MKRNLIRLAHSNPELRSHLVPLLRGAKSAGSVKGPGIPDGTGPHKGTPECPFSEKEEEGEEGEGKSAAKKKWIPKDLEEGRCTPGSPNYDCPKGSPQYNLAQTFKKHPEWGEKGGKKATFWDNRRETPAGKSYPKSVWDRLPEAKRPFGWSTPARGPSGKYPEPWRTSDKDAALALLKSLGADRDIYTDYWSEDPDHMEIWVGYRDNRDGAAHAARIQALGDALKKKRLPFEFHQGSRGPEAITLVDDLKKYVLRRGASKTAGFFYQLDRQYRPLVSQVGKALGWDTNQAAAFAVAILEDVNLHSEAAAVDRLLTR